MPSTSLCRLLLLLLWPIMTCLVRLISGTIDGLDVWHLAQLLVARFMRSMPRMRRTRLNRRQAACRRVFLQRVKWRWFRRRQRHSRSPHVRTVQKPLPKPPPSSPHFTLFVALPDATTLTLSLSPQDCNMAFVYGAVSHRLGLQSNAFSLQSTRSILNAKTRTRRQQSLRELGFCDGTTLHVSFRLRGGGNAFMNTFANTHQWRQTVPLLALKPPSQRRLIVGVDVSHLVYSVFFGAAFKSRQQELCGCERDDDVDG